jgi:hypothetical protein
MSKYAITTTYGKLALRPTLQCSDYRQENVVDQYFYSNENNLRVVQVVARNIKASALALPDKVCLQFAEAIHAVATSLAPGQSTDVSLSTGAFADDGVRTKFEVHIWAYSDGYNAFSGPQGNEPFDWEAAKGPLWP